MNRQIAFLQFVVCIAIVPLLFVPGCNKPAAIPPGKRNAAKDKESTKVRVSIVREQTLRETIELPATVESDETAILMARVEAYVDEVLVDIGDEVQARQVLIRLEAPEFKHQVTEQRALARQIQADEQVLLSRSKSSPSAS